MSSFNWLIGDLNSTNTRINSDLEEYIYMYNSHRSKKKKQLCGPLSIIHLGSLLSCVFNLGSDKAYFVDLFVRASNTPAIKMYEKVMISGSSSSLLWLFVYFVLSLSLPP